MSGHHGHASHKELASATGGGVGNKTSAKLETVEPQPWLETPESIAEKAMRGESVYAPSAQGLQKPEPSNEGMDLRMAKTGGSGKQARDVDLSGRPGGDSRMHREVPQAGKLSKGK